MSIPSPVHPSASRPPARTPGNTAIAAPRVLVVTAYYHPFVGGVETHARHLVGYLDRGGFRPIVLTKTVHGHRPGWTEVDGIPVFRIPPGGDRKGSQKWIMIPPLALAILCLARRVDVLYCPDFRGIGMAAVGAGWLARRPVVLGGHNLGVINCSSWNGGLRARGLDPQGIFARALKWPVRRIYCCADAHTGICREILDEAREAGVPEDRIHYVPNAVDLATFHAPRGSERKRIRRQEGWADDETVGLFVGRLSAEKGLVELLEGWVALRARGEKIRLAVVGPDMPGHAMDVGKQAREFVRDQGLSDRVDFLGERADVARLLRGADFLLQPSHYESFGLSVIEAMATGLPVAASRVGGMVDYLVHEENALLCPPASPAAFAEAALRLARDPELRRRLGEAGRRTVENAFGDEQVHGALARIFFQVHRRRRRADADA